LSRKWRGRIKLNDEHSEWKWFTASDIPESISPPIKPVIAQFKSKSNPTEES
jgi:hypothetical protein